MNRMFSCAALALLLSASPASVMAQTTGSTDPAATTPAQPEQKAPPPKPVEGQIVAQDSQTFLASNLIGAYVYSPDGKEIGSVSDLIIRPNGNVDGLVVSFGGFLGLGKKEVAVAMNKFTTQKMPDQVDLRLVLNATREDLSAAPDFKSVETQKLEREQQQEERQVKNQNQDNATTPLPQIPAEPKSQ